MASTLMRPVPSESLESLVDISRISAVRMPLWKRLTDIAVASAALVVLSPLLVIIGLSVMLESPGGAVFRQARVGRGGKCFTCWKFRTMQRGADSMLVALLAQNEANEFVFKMKDDPRRTRVGRLLRKTSLDELPQLWNVLRGDMSLVGPRPPTVVEVLRYDERHLQRLRATPGITGLWQVTLRGRRHEFIDMVELDVRYADEFSFTGDLKILLGTIPTVLFGRGSY
jgi:lipopolysaccharide/colanic/teichoic acid biosynthesis glycosyltransferase